MKKYIFLLFFFSNLFVFSQNEKLDRISLEYRHSIKRNSKIEISIYPSYKTQNGFIVHSEINKEIYEKEISNSEFMKIEKAIMKVKVKDLYNNFKFGVDGALTEISFGDTTNAINYKIWGLSRKDKKTSYKHFLKVTQMILKLADANIDEIN